MGAVIVHMLNVIEGEKKERGKKRNACLVLCTCMFNVLVQYTLCALIAYTHALYCIYLSLAVSTVYARHCAPLRVGSHKT